MHFEVFNKIVENRLKKCINLLIPKGKEYSRNGDRLHNFKYSGRIDGESPEQALWGMWKKHITSIHDMIEDVNKEILPSEKMMDDKFCDMINYTLLLEGLIKERIMNKGKEK